MKLRQIPRYILSIFLASLLIVILSSCADNTVTPEIYSLVNFRDIPGVTAEDIRAIEELQESGVSFSYGMTRSLEAFTDEFGTVGGFSALVCEWLSEVFEIQFTPYVYDWGVLIEGFDRGDIDFTGELTATDERREIYHMTDTIAERQLIVVRMKDMDLQEIDRPRYAFFENSTTEDLVKEYLDDYEPLFVSDYAAAYEMLKNGEADALFSEGGSEVAFHVYDDIATNHFFPLIFTSVSLSTANPELAPVIDIVQKALDDGAMHHLISLYNDGHQHYLRNRYKLLLTEEEREFLNSKPVIPLAAEVNNYPVSFYNDRLNEWQGIAIDVIEDLEKITGLEFEIVNSKDEEWAEVLDALKTGRAAMVTELIYTDERAEKFIWPENKLFTNRFILISKIEHPNIKVNEIPLVRVGTVKGTAQEDLFRQWFPNHRYSTEYEHNTAAVEALERGDIDMMITSQSLLLNITNYREQVGYKANYIFDTTFETTFGFNKDYETICSLVDKGLSLVDAEGISSHWMRRTFDYRIKLARQRNIWLIGLTTFFLLLVFISILFLRKRGECRHL